MPDHIMCETRGVVKSMAIGMNHHKNYHWDIWWASHTTESSCMSRQIAEGVVGSVLPTTLSCTHQPAPLFESSAWLPRRLLHHPTRSTNICVQLPLQWTRLPLRLVTQSRTTRYQQPQHQNQTYEKLLHKPTMPGYPTHLCVIALLNDDKN